MPAARSTRSKFVPLESEMLVPVLMTKKRGPWSAAVQRSVHAQKDLR